MNGVLHFINVAANYLGSASFSIQIEFYFEQDDIRNKFQLGTVYDSGEFVSEKTTVNLGKVSPSSVLSGIQGFMWLADGMAAEEYLEKNKMKIIEAFKYNMYKEVLNMMNEYEDLHPYRVEWLVS